MDSHHAKHNSDVSQDGALARTGFVTEGTGLRKQNCKQLFMHIWTTGIKVWLRQSAPALHCIEYLKEKAHSLTHWMARLFVEQPRLHRVPEISLRRRHAQTVKNGASSQKTNYTDIFQRFKIFAVLVQKFGDFTE